MHRAVVAGSPTRLLAAGGDQDSYLNKLVKYVPVEGLAPFLPIAASVDHEWEVWVTFVVALVVGVAVIATQVKAKGPPGPRMWYWPFVVIAFAAWSVGASQQFREVLGVSESTGAFILGLTAIALPALDSALDALIP